MVGGGCLPSGGSASSRVCLQGRSACGGFAYRRVYIKVGLHWGGGGVVGQTPPPELGRWTVRILLECFLVEF